MSYNRQKEVGGGGGALSNCALTGSEELVRPEAVRAAGETGSDTKVTEEEAGYKNAVGVQTAPETRASATVLCVTFPPRCAIPGQANSSDDC